MEKTAQRTREGGAVSVAVVSAGPSAAAPVLRRILGEPVTVLDPYDLAMDRGEKCVYRVVLVEDFAPRGREEALSVCAPVRWEMAGKPLTVVSLDDPDGRRLALQLGKRAFAYSDGKTEADLTAKNVNLRWGRLEFEALTDQDIVRVRLPEDETDLYGPLAALACALSLGMPLSEAARRLSEAG